jgi:hypothetical protein
MAAAQEEDFVDYEEDEEQVAVQAGKDTKKYANAKFSPDICLSRQQIAANPEEMRTISNRLLCP